MTAEEWSAAAAIASAVAAFLSLGIATLSFRKLSQWRRVDRERRSAEVAERVLMLLNPFQSAVEDASMAHEDHCDVEAGVWPKDAEVDEMWERHREVLDRWCEVAPLAQVHLSPQAGALVKEINAIVFMIRGSQGTAESVADLWEGEVHSAEEIADILRNRKIPRRWNGDFLRRVNRLRDLLMKEARLSD